MPTLIIEGKKIEVDDSFLSLTPEKQNETVDEIAQSLSIQKAEPEGGEQEEARWDHKVGAAIDGVAQSLTFQTSDEIAAGMATGFGVLGDYDSALAEERARMQENKRLASHYELGGQVAGGLVGAGGLVKSGLTAIKSGVPAIKQLFRMSAESGVHGTLHGAGAAEEGDRISGGLSGAAIGLGTGIAAPLIIAGGGALKRRAVDKITEVVNPALAAKNSIIAAKARDAGQNILTDADELMAIKNDQVIINADRGGRTTQALSKAAANASPEARAVIEDVVDKRYKYQFSRGVDFLTKLAGGKADDAALLDTVEAAARKTNKVAYERAYSFNFGKNHPIEIDNILKRIPEKAFTNAREIAKLNGVPFGKQLIGSIDEATGEVKYLRSPSMEELDLIQRGLRDLRDQAFNSGGGGLGSAYKNLHKEFLGVLDDVNPLFKKARLGASEAFGAEDAIAAGRKFAGDMVSSKTLEKAFNKYSKTEQDGFRTAFTAALIDKTNRGGFSRNIIDSVFEKPVVQAKIKTIFGPTGAREVEGFVRIEQTMNWLRTSLKGNSTTVRQLQELSLIGGGSATYGLTTGDTTNAGVGLAYAALRFGNQRLNNKVLIEIGRLLTSTDKSVVTDIVSKGAKSKQYFESIKTVTGALMMLNAPVAGAVGAGALRE